MFHFQREIQGWNSEQGEFEASTGERPLPLSVSVWCYSPKFCWTILIFFGSQVISLKVIGGLARGFTATPQTVGITKARKEENGTRVRTKETYI